MNKLSFWIILFENSFFWNCELCRGYRRVLSGLWVCCMPCFFFFFFLKQPHRHRIPGQFSRNVVDIWSGPFWKQPSHEAQTDWLTPLAKLQLAHWPYFTQNKKAREHLSLSLGSNSEFMCIFLPSTFSSLDGLSCPSFRQQGFLFSEP